MQECLDQQNLEAQSRQEIEDVAAKGRDNTAEVKRMKADAEANKQPGSQDEILSNVGMQTTRVMNL